MGYVAREKKPNREMFTLILWQPTPVLLPGESHGQRSLVGYSPWGWKESGTIERLHFHFLSPVCLKTHAE